MPTLAARHPPHFSYHALHPREPGLINLPLYLPSIPILNPVVTPLIEGAKFAQPSPTTTQPSESPPQETPTTVYPSPTNTGGGGDSGGDSGPENEGSNSGDPGQSGSEGSSSGDSGMGAHSVPSTGGGEGQNSGVTGTSSGLVQAPSGISESVSSVATPSSSSSSTNGGYILADGNTPANAANDPSNSNSGGGSGSGSASVGSGNVSGNGNGGPTRVGDIPGASGMPAATGMGGGIGGGNGGGNGNGNTVGTSAEVKHGLSGGTISGIVIAVLLVAVALIVILLRRFKSRRSERRNRWWFSRDGFAQAYGDRDAGVNGSGGITVFAKRQRRSVRSSFETTVDYSVTPRLGEDLDIPSLPPMAELRGTPLLVNLDSPVAPPVGTHSPVKVTPETRFSVGTVSSIGSDGQGQWLVVNRDDPAQEVGTPMSVRPFSPTESFAFPKPPAEKGSGDWGSQFSRPASLHTMSASGNKNINGYGICSSVTEEVPALPVPSPAANPFNDPDPIVLYSTAAAVLGANPGPGTLAQVNAVTVKSSTDPFADPEPKMPSPVNPEFREIETIKRPFVPSLDDELSVDLGDKVRILQLFDDGWALVEKNPACGSASMKGKGREPDRGLIPIDCFRGQGVELLTFISSKRVSSYSQTSGK